MNAVNERIEVPDATCIGRVDGWAFSAFKNREDCIDIHCPKCGEHNTASGRFLSYLECDECGTLFRLSPNIPYEIIYPDTPNNQHDLAVKHSYIMESESALDWRSPDLSDNDPDVITICRECSATKTRLTEDHRWQYATTPEDHNPEPSACALCRTEGTVMPDGYSSLFLCRKKWLKR